MNPISILLLILILLQTHLHGQQNEPEPAVYNINKKIEIPATVGLYIGVYFGFQYLFSKPGLNEFEISKLDRMDIWKFDRIATEQNPDYRQRAHDNSDFFLNASVVLPGLLALDKNIRKDWLDLLVLYTETHAINTSIYLMTASSIERTRPFLYHPDIPVEAKIGEQTRNSFFSGHVSTSATSSFFMAKVYSDYHPELGNKKYLLFGAALIPPFLVGYYRVKAMKHFPTDVITGGIIGAAIGILVPHLHKNKNRNSNFSFMPFTGGASGMKISYSIK